jgi:hypothetical protein
MRYTGKAYGGQISHVGASVIIRGPGENRLRNATICHIMNDGAPEILTPGGSDGRKPLAFIGEPWNGYVPPPLRFVPTVTAEDIESLPEGSWTWVLIL